ncbi:sulfotransferase domain-containing protein [Halobacillus salinarum]|uniref:Sulfotransferase domain-containing protein n=1 Tax=Halobacillus salinarum TaxID=2932257 RepID=A0ABY4EMJ6_9BACI|nr:sulfotransferase domain-containing protein [Halobacillus salinarum]UOQ45394.1 sulfotransferase domain-containing protein [Halobacillus salinarum]
MLNLSEVIKRLKFPYRLITSKQRMLPNFLIVGVQKGGTTSLYNYLVQHPQVMSSNRKEVHYFDNNFSKGESWYKAHFPTCDKSGNVITGDASPYYFYHPLVPQRVYESSPDMKIIVLLRDPIKRAYSHYNHNIKNGREDRPFEKAINDEQSIIESEEKKLLKNRKSSSYFHQHYSYLSRGLYYEQLKRWLEFFPEEQICVLNSEEFYNSPSTSFNQVTDFLEIDNWEPKEFKVFNKGNNYEEIPSEIFNRLKDYYTIPNTQLFKLISKDYEWDLR